VIQKQFRNSKYCFAMAQELFRILAILGSFCYGWRRISLSTKDKKGEAMVQSAATPSSTRDGLVLDTSVPMHDAGCFMNFGEHDVYFTLTSLGELDRLKDGSLGRDGRKGFLAREALKALVQFEQGDLYGEGVSLPGGGRLFFDGGAVCKKMGRADRKKFPLGEDCPDNRIIQAAWCLDQSRAGRYNRVRFISKDLGQRMKARACGLLTEDYLHDRIGSIDELYQPCACLQLGRNQYDELVAGLMKHHKGQGFLGVSKRELGHVDVELPDKLYHNQCFTLAAVDQSRPSLNIVFRAPHDVDSGRFFWIEDVTRNPKVNRNIAPKNPEQHMAYQFLVDPSVEIVALLGRQGTGKTLLAVQAAWEQVVDGYNEIIIFRPNIELGSPMGFLPGGRDEKMAPWMLPIFDQLEVISRTEKTTHGRRHHDDCDDPDKARAQERNLGLSLIEKGLLSIEPIAYIRGRSFHRKLVIVDEAQNLTPQEIKIMIGRAGEGTKIVLAGDARQVDHKYLDPFSNGLSHVTARFRGQTNFAFVALQEVERSRLAEQADSLL
jgi:PhoH-like ATPase